MTITVGLGGVSKHGCAAISDGRRILGVCAQERVTRVRDAGFSPTGLPDEAIDTLLERAGRSRKDIRGFAVGEEGARTNGLPLTELAHHYAHACTAYLTSPFSSATIVICDEDAPKLSVWSATQSEITPVEWKWDGIGFVDLHAACASLAGTGSAGAGQRFEGLARLVRRSDDKAVDALFDSDGHRLILAPDWQARVAAMLPPSWPDGDVSRAAAVAAALQGRLGDLFVQLLESIQQVVGGGNLCLGGSFFHHSYINTLARQSGLYSRVFVPVDPGNAGLAAGTALQATGALPQNLSPFLGPSYAPDEIKATLDNCKLPYNWVDEAEAVAIAVDALQHGRVVGWFEGAMEWGNRALGARSILANPFAPYVLENLNRFLKRRQAWRGYALSTLEGATEGLLEGPERAPYMECDYRVLDVDRFAHVMPSTSAALRVHTAGAEAPPRFRDLLQAFGKAAGAPYLVNTSFNGFHEPIVCTPRDAVRVFFGSGVDVLILDRFVLTK